MGETLLTEEKIQEIVNWLREDYDAICRACEENKLPKPPRW
ncbi:MAG: hypothetical protein ABR613_03225 [Actinomycetota bacterium]